MSVESVKHDTVESLQAEHNSLESKMEKLEGILKTLENNDLPLEESVKLYEEGVALQAECQRMLEELKIKVSKVASEGPGEDNA